MYDMIVECAILVFMYMTLLFIVAAKKKDNSIADIGWGIGFMLIAAYSLWQNNIITARHALITIMVLIWGARLSIHIFIRNKGKSEDPRYAQWRISWGKYALLRSYIQVFMLQGLLILVIALPIIAINTSTNKGLNLLDMFGCIVWLIGLLCEITADFQLASFLKKPESKGRLLTQGIWKYSRHPNYFGETLIWWGVFLVALSVPHGLITIISPLTITYLLLFVSGVPLAEKQIEALPEFAHYKKTTPLFIPWFKKKD